MKNNLKVIKNHLGQIKVNVSNKNFAWMKKKVKIR